MAMRNRPGRISVALVLLVCGGCAWFNHPDFRFPNWRSPGPAYYQQYQAIGYDPYPQDDVGPEIVGGRPRSYQKPAAEVTRVRQSRPWGNWRSQ